MNSMTIVHQKSVPVKRFDEKWLCHFQCAVRQEAQRDLDLIHHSSTDTSREDRIFQQSERRNGYKKNGTIDKRSLLSPLKQRVPAMKTFLVSLIILMLHYSTENIFASSRGSVIGFELPSSLFSCKVFVSGFQHSNTKFRLTATRRHPLPYHQQKPKYEPKEKSMDNCRLEVCLRLRTSAVFSQFSSSSEAGITSSSTPSKSKTDNVRAGQQRQPLWPKVGDIVRYYDLDGGKKKGQVLVGRISFIQKKLNSPGNSYSGNDIEWVFELTELEDVGDGYYADYSAAKRSFKKAIRPATDVAPIAASYVRSQGAYKVPRIPAVPSSTLISTTTTNTTATPVTMVPLTRADSYDMHTYPGPYYVNAANVANGSEDDMNARNINNTVVETDALLYGELKRRLVGSTILAGLFGTVVADFVGGFESAVIYAAGSISSVLYLLLLALKTDTLASPTGPRYGNALSNLRFFMPVLVFIGIALYNQSLGSNNPVLLATTIAGMGPDGADASVDSGYFTTITPQQYGAAILGFLTYRIPLFITQIQDAFSQSTGTTTIATITEEPGSATGMALQMIQQQAQKATGGSQTTAASTSLGGQQQQQTVLLVSGPKAAGRTALVQRFLRESSLGVDASTPMFLEPNYIDRLTDPVTFERFEQRQKILSIDQTGRYGLTEQSFRVSSSSSSFQSALLNKGMVQNQPQQVVVVDANVDLARKIVSSVPNIRVVGVWVALNDIKEFERRIADEIDSSGILFQEQQQQQKDFNSNNDTSNMDLYRESLIRARIKEVVSEIEYGITSGIFEFTILNTNEDDSLRQLKEAASYCLL